MLREQLDDSSIEVDPEALPLAYDPLPHRVRSLGSPLQRLPATRPMVTV